MSRIRRAKPSPALVVSLVALFVALGSGAFAASKIGSEDIKAGAVKSKQIADDGVKSKDLRDGKAVKSRDVKDQTLTGEDIDEQTLGTVPSAARADSAQSLDGFDPSNVLRGDGVYDAATGTIEVDTGTGAVGAPVVTIEPLEVAGWCDRVDDEVGGQVGNLGTNPALIWVQDLAAAPPEVDDDELNQFDGLASARDPQSRIVSWIGSTGGRQFSVEMAMRIIQNGDGTATCDYEARVFLGD